MDWERIQGNWKHYKLIAAQRWTRISADEFDLLGGRRAELAGHIAEVYRISPGAAEMQLDSWQGQQREPGPAPA